MKPSTSRESLFYSFPIALPFFTHWFSRIYLFFYIFFVVKIVKFLLCSKEEAFLLNSFSWIQT